MSTNSEKILVEEELHDFVKQQISAGQTNVYDLRRLIQGRLKWYL